MEKIKHLPINWANSQKTNNTRFFEAYYNVVEMLRQNREEKLASYSYGFGDKSEKEECSIDMDIKGESAETLSVELRACNTVTRNGYHILFTEESYGDFAPKYTLKGIKIDLSTRQVVCILLTVNPHKMLPVGVPDPEATPLHHPYISPEVTLQLVLEQNLNKTFLRGGSIVMGKAIVDGSSSLIDSDYIPAIQRVSCSGRAMHTLENMTETLKHIHSNALKIYAKNISNPHRSMLTDNTSVLCDMVKNFYSQYYFGLKNIAAEQPPIYTVRFVNVLANLLLTSLRSLPERDFETLLQYFDEWTNIKPSDFVRRTSDIAYLSYNHLRLGTLFVSIVAFPNVVNAFFHKLNRLEYVGLTKEDIIISEDSSDKVSENEHKS